MIDFIAATSKTWTGGGSPTTVRLDRPPGARKGDILVAWHGVAIADVDSAAPESPGFTRPEGWDWWLGNYDSYYAAGAPNTGVVPLAGFLFQSHRYVGELEDEPDYYDFEIAADCHGASALLLWRGPSRTVTDYCLLGFPAGAGSLEALADLGGYVSQELDTQNTNSLAPYVDGVLATYVFFGFVAAGDDKPGFGVLPRGGVYGLVWNKDTGVLAPLPVRAHVEATGSLCGLVIVDEQLSVAALNSREFTEYFVMAENELKGGLVLTQVMEPAVGPGRIVVPRLVTAGGGIGLGVGR